MAQARRSDQMVVSFSGIEEKFNGPDRSVQLRWLVGTRVIRRPSSARQSMHRKPSSARQSMYRKPSTPALYAVSPFQYATSRAFMSPVTKIDDPREPYVITAFCYGCNLGPTKTARSIKLADRRQLSFINQRHITEQKLNEAIVEVINAYRNFPLQRLWGLGKTGSADGTKWDLYPQNLMSEYHIRYGGYGGIGYYLIADSYIALFSRFNTCGSWEGHYILDFITENDSEVKPDTVHSDTQGQSEPIFGLAHLLGIKLMPRIRNWKNLHFYKPDRVAEYKHIGSLFSNEPIDWNLIETMLPDMLRVALSVKTGKITPSAILRRLATYSRRNKLYFAFRELGRVVRTMFLLGYISDVEVRRMS